MNAESLPILFRAPELSAFAREAESALARAEAENWGYQMAPSSRGGGATITVKPRSRPDCEMWSRSRPAQLTAWP